MVRVPSVEGPPVHGALSTQSALRTPSFPHFTRPPTRSQITIVTGASGNHELYDKCQGVDLVLSATCSQNYGCVCV
jgi:hypothetical protein